MSIQHTLNAQSRLGAHARPIRTFEVHVTLGSSAHVLLLGDARKRLETVIRHASPGAIVVWGTAPAALPTHVAVSVPAEFGPLEQIARRAVEAAVVAAIVLDRERRAGCLDLAQAAVPRVTVEQAPQPATREELVALLRETRVALVCRASGRSAISSFGCSDCGPCVQAAAIDLVLAREPRA